MVEDMENPPSEPREEIEKSTRSALKKLFGAITRPWKLFGRKRDTSSTGNVSSIQPSQERKKEVKPELDGADFKVRIEGETGSGETRQIIYGRFNKIMRESVLGISQRIRIEHHLGDTPMRIVQATRTLLRDNQIPGQTEQIPGVEILYKPLILMYSFHKQLSYGGQNEPITFYFKKDTPLEEMERWTIQESYRYQGSEFLLITWGIRKVGEDNDGKPKYEIRIKN